MGQASFCDQCGNRLRPATRFCTSCGALVDDIGHADVADAGASALRPGKASGARRITFFTALVAIAIVTSGVLAYLEYTGTLNLAAMVRPSKTLSIDGLGPVKIGMTIDQASAAWGAKLEKLDWGQQEFCTYVPYAFEGSKDAYFFVRRQDGRIHAACAGTEDIEGPGGIRLHDPASRLDQLPRELLAVMGNHYRMLKSPNADGHILWIETQPGELIASLRPLPQGVLHIHRICASTINVRDQYMRGGC